MRIFWSPDRLEDHDSFKIKGRPTLALVISIAFFSLLAPSIGCHSVQEIASTPHSPGLLPVVQNGRTGYIDTSGNIIIAPQFEGNQSADMWRVIGPALDRHTLLDQHLFQQPEPMKLGTKWGFITRAGSLVFSTQFELARKFSEGLAAVCLGECEVDLQEVLNDGPRLRRFRKLPARWGYIDLSGHLVITPQSTMRESFQRG